MNVVYSFTRAVYHMVAPSMRSLVEHNPDVKIWVLCEDDELDLPVPATVINVADQEWFPPDGPNYKNYWSYINLLKVRYPSILPDLDKVIHLDIDTIVWDDLTELWETDLTGKWFAAVPEWRGAYKPFGPIYYNAGILLINLEQMRKDGVEYEMTEFLNTAETPYADQNAWNIFGIFCDKAVTLPVRWNEAGVTGYTDDPGINHWCAIRDWWDNPDIPRRFLLEMYKE